ncbi:hypothetical protein DFA_07122 [Cavenderia fasciculata]|uniref:Uncharacterized protein n=1 Tax=Cavenderia fasciculata TaxID=261658 RepID=F4PVJ2_CACFS|nr:uncharacterized protein DFA_07122 [Cavenderia fasciculata]EGG20006.1 hypothetical protein DFA_07122 [Cavenderia fasciculata]|eukprot:XP_004366989.1 hypothetical protein DFA_07122 [Cavenderia fasciculata]
MIFGYEQQQQQQDSRGSMVTNHHNHHSQHYFRTNPGYDALTAHPSRFRLYINMKLFICISLIIISGISLMWYIDFTQYKYIAWSLTTMGFALIWGLLIVKYQAYKDNNGPVDSYATVPLSADNESMEL